MIPLVEQHKDAVVALCRRYRVQRLYIFGSAAEGRFDAQRSDLDFLVKMADREPTGRYADRILDLAEGLEQLFKRRVDLVTEESIRNPYFRQHVKASRQLIYGESDQEAAA
jgi:predicted nucleotidyltransferase